MLDRKISSLIMSILASIGPRVTEGGLRDYAIPEVLPPAVGMSEYYIRDAAMLDTKSAAHTQAAKPYDPNESIIYKHICGLDEELFAYMVIGIVAILLCMFIIYSTILIPDPSTGDLRGIPHYDLYLSNARFIPPILLIIGGIMSALLMSYIAYCIRSPGVFALFVIAWVFIIFWYLNLMFRIEKVANGEDHDGNGTGYLAIAIVLILSMAYLAWNKNPMYGLAMLVPAIWYMIVFYFWLFDEYSGTRSSYGRMY